MHWTICIMDTSEGRLIKLQESDKFFSIKECIETSGKIKNLATIITDYKTTFSCTKSFI